MSSGESFGDKVKGENSNFNGWEELANMAQGSTVNDNPFHDTSRDIAELARFDGNESSEEDLGGTHDDEYTPVKDNHEAQEEANQEYFETVSKIFNRRAAREAYNETVAYLTAANPDMSASEIYERASKAAFNAGMTPTDEQLDEILRNLGISDEVDSAGDAVEPKDAARLEELDNKINADISEDIGRDFAPLPIKDIILEEGEATDVPLDIK